MPRFFNTTGPCNPEDHYTLPPEARMADLLPLVQQKQYFVMHAARQTGKTTAMRAFAARLRGLGMVGVWATLEESQGVTEPSAAEPLWICALEDAAARVLPEAQRPPAARAFLQDEPGNRLRRWLSAWAERVAPAPLVLLLDEADVVSGPALVSLLRQLRAGFMDRGPGRFPVSIGLIGMRDLRDYLTEAKDGVAVNPGSPFNVKSESITLRDFSAEEVAQLYAQHTAETGQVFTPDAVARAYELTQGQPFLVNALARIAVMKLVTDPTQPITRATIDRAKEALILSRTTHLDSLAQRLREPRVATIVEAVLLGDQHISYQGDDFQYVLDLGLIRRGPDGAEAANPLYREVLGRSLSANAQDNLPRPWWPWKHPDGRLDMEALVNAFLQWWRENADMIRKHDDTPYTEAMAHLAFMGFLQRVVNGGGTVDREYAAGRGRVDLIVTYGPDRFLIELKRVPPEGRTLKQIQKQGVAQLSTYLDTLGLQEGWLIIFDQRPGLTWRRRMWRKELTVAGRALHLRGS